MIYYMSIDDKLAKEPKNDVNFKFDQSKITPLKVAIMSEDVSVTSLKKLSRKLNCTINDILLSVYSNTLCEYL